MSQYNNRVKKLAGWQRAASSLLQVQGCAQVVYGLNQIDDMGIDLLETHQNTGNAFSLLVFRNFVWLTIPFCMAISWVFNSIEKVGETSENPFEGIPTDIPISGMSRAIEIDLLELLDEPVVPAPMVAVNDIEM